ncbi:hypothetical protein [Actinokineospora enzanensis]|uniref:hypothetical protein n=1 Tax=Actinokineospora enzanensis TaxID=155975 RepID=UPI000360CF18|nr:hypothetical protein [Actinokineospora enzanensis]
MTYPPQPPGPDPNGPGYGAPGWGPPQQPPGYPAQPGGYQGLGTFGGGEPPRPPRNTGRIVAIAIIAVLVLGGAGVGVWALTRDKGGSADTGTSASTGKTGGRTGSTGDDSGSKTGAAKDSPDSVRDDYMAAYEANHFADVLDGACDAYKQKYGTDAAELEKTLKPYEVKASADGDADVSGSTASARIDLELTENGNTQRVPIEIKIVKEDGHWKFCGEQRG